MKTVILLLAGVINFWQICQADVILDGSFGRTDTLSGRELTIDATLGQSVGNNLFHSFKTFNLQSDQVANFTGSPTTKNIISRVTGGKMSIIDGTIHSTLPADLYFINPAGIMFGKNAKLDLAASAHFSTASVIKLGESGQFSATAPQTSVLTVAAPSAFGFLDLAPLTLQGSELQLPAGHTLSLLAGGITLDDGHISIPEGSLQLVSVAAAEELALQNNRLEPITAHLLGNLTLNHTVLETNGMGGGMLTLRGGNIQLHHSELLAKSTNQDGQPIDIQAENLDITDSSRLSTSTEGSGRSGMLTIRVAGDLTLSDDSWLSANTLNTQADAGDAGEIHLLAKNLTIANDSQISSATLGYGRAGTIMINVADKIELSNRSTIRVLSQAQGNAGIIRLEADKLHLSENTEISSKTSGTGQGGSVSIDARQEANFDGAAVLAISQSDQPDAGNAGDITLTTNKLLMQNGAQLTSGTFGGGQGGSVVVHANHAILEGYKLAEDDNVYATGVTTSTAGMGDAGKIQVTVNHLEIKAGAGIGSDTYGAGQAGQITVEAAQSIDISSEISDSLTKQQENDLGRGITSKSLDQLAGNSGNLLIRTPILNLTGHGSISTSAQQAQAGKIVLDVGQLKLQDAAITSEGEGDGDAGNIVITTAKDLLLTQAAISTQALYAAGGNISLFINGKLLYLAQRAAITTSVKGGMGGGGDIEVTQPQFAVLNNSLVIAQADGGNGGNISISPQHFISSPLSLVSASSRRGIDGEVIIRAPESDVSCGLITLPNNFLAADQLLKKPCRYRAEDESISRFTVKPSEGVPNIPEDLQDSFHLTHR